MWIISDWQRVQNGAKYLDGVRPNWREEIRPLVKSCGLRVSKKDRCVLGLLYGDYDAALVSLNLSPEDEEKYGFTYPLGICLNLFWRLEIMKRK